MPQANAQTLIIENDIKLLREDHKALNARFDKHLDIYAQNGKELAALKVSVDNLANAVRTMDTDHGKNNDNQWKEIKQNSTDINTLQIEISKLGVRIGMWAALGSTAASTIMVFLVQKMLI